MQTTDLVALSLPQRLQAMEALWASLCQEPSMAQQIPDWHQEVLSQRLEALDSGEEIVTPWDTAKDRIRQQARQSQRSWYSPASIPSL